MATRVSRWSERSTHPERHPDLRSWTVRTGRDREDVGEVEEVLLDEEGRPRYLEVDLRGSDRTVLVPAGHAHTDPDDDVVWIPGLERDRLADVPAWESRDVVDEEYERTLARAYDGAYSAEGYYESPHFRTSGRTRARHETGSATPARVDSLEDIDVADHDPDPRGWSVVGRDGEELGRVDHLLGETRSMKVRHFVVELTDAGTDEDRHVLVPAGHVELDQERKHARVPALERGLLDGYPRWSGDGVQREHEREVTRYLDGAYTGGHRYRHPRYRAEWLRRR